MKEPEVINAVIGPRVDNVFDKESISLLPQTIIPTVMGRDCRPIPVTESKKDLSLPDSGIRWSFRQRRLGKRKDINASKKVS